MADIEGPFEGFDPRLRRVFQLPVEMRPEYDTSIGVNEAGGLLVDRNGNVWWVPRG